ncbi:hypothetical protein H5P28_11295 [Ruficoccus amylovorans]|uniref:Uncharacterized protein n=1 Tax=Ruficoccus amylovorans TaxID=1804625 RepID=A0A842HH06_9BACT|nr:hypothetical protein [Ruficoccus amylovorans]MBC2594844.1 hypothetical protein [Ruficoccus amylovorans]
MTKQLTLGATAVVMSVASAFAAPIVLDQTYSGISYDSGRKMYLLTADVNLPANGNDGYIIEGNLVVPAGMTLTLQPGVIMRGQPEFDPNTDIPGALVVARDGTLIAEGTASNPIIFTTAADTNRQRWQSGDTFLDADPKNNPLPPVTVVDAETSYANTSLWGAVTLLGNAPTNLGINASDVGYAPYTTQPGLGIIEGFGINEPEFVYGGSQPNDSSGSLRYVSIRHTGSTFGNASEQQGLTLGAVGYGTQLEYIDIYCSSDDGIEIFGGTAALKYLMISYAKDDSLDLDQGYTGFVQFAFILGNGLAGDTAALLGPASLAEWDGDDVGEPGNNLNTVNGAPFSSPTLYNITFFGGNSRTFSDGAILRLRHNFGGNLYNSIVAFAENGQNGLVKVLGSDNYNVDGSNTPHAAILYGYPNPSATEQAAAGTLNIAGTLFWKVGDSVAANVAANDTTLEILTNNATSGVTGITCPGAFGNVVANSGASNPFFGQTGNAADANDQTTANGVNPVPLSATAVAATVGYTGTFFDEVTYSGAFAPSFYTPLYTNGWTAMNARGILVNSGL